MWARACRTSTAVVGLGKEWQVQRTRGVLDRNAKGKKKVNMKAWVDRGGLTIMYCSKLDEPTDPLVYRALS